MSRIRDAEHSQLVEAMRRRVAELEIEVTQQTWFYLLNMPVLMFREFGLKMPIFARFWVVFGDLNPWMGHSINETRKRKIYGS